MEAQTANRVLIITVPKIGGPTLLRPAMEERRVSFAAQNEIDAEQAFLNSMKALQELDEAGASPAPAREAAAQDSSVSFGSEVGNGVDIGGDYCIGPVETNAEDQKVTPCPGSGVSAIVGTTAVAVAGATPASPGSTTSPVVKPDVPQENISILSSVPTTASFFHRRPPAPFSYEEDDEEEPGPAATPTAAPTATPTATPTVAIIKDEVANDSTKSTATTPTLSATPVPSSCSPVAMARNFPNGSHVSLTSPAPASVSASISAPANNMPLPTPPNPIVAPEDTSTQTPAQNANPVSTPNEIQQSNIVPGTLQEKSQPAMGVVSHSPSNVPVASTAATNTTVSTATATSTVATTAPSNKRKRLPQDKVGQLEDRIAEDPRGDTDAWYNLVAEYQKKGKFDEARAVFERFFLVFPACVRVKISFCF